MYNVMQETISQNFLRSILQVDAARANELYISGQYNKTFRV